ncbi:MAG: glycosyltransferase family protein [Gammaproteobacteria bacterium]|nr:glycosyltransferase family protein [Gammaproteobacteria bacterium]
MNIVAIIQARMSSHRLPGKVMKMTQGKTVLRHVIERVASCNKINDIVVATTKNSDDDIISNESFHAEAKVYRGSLDNVLDRYYHAAQLAKADIIVRITSDCPLIDPDVVSQLIDHFINHPNKDIHYVRGNGFPIGVNAEVFTFDALERSWHEASIDYEFEHVTPYIYNHPELFTIDFLDNIEDLSRLRLTLDTPEDWQLIDTLYERLNTGLNKFISLNEILELLTKEPELININRHIKQKTLGE